MRLAALLQQRRSAAVGGAVAAAAHMPEHRSGGLTDQVELEQHLRDVDFYGRLLSELRTDALGWGGPYDPGKGTSFYLDLVAGQRADRAAMARLQEHAERTGQLLALEQRDVGSSAFGVGLVPPSFPDIAAGDDRAGGALIDALPPLDLPDVGQSVIVPRVTGGVADSQTSENTTLTESVYSAQNLTAPVATISTVVNCSVQVLDRSGGRGQAFMTRDLAEAVDTEVDRQVIEGTGLNGEMAGILSVTNATSLTWTDATPSRVEFLNRIARVAGDASGTRKRNVDTLVMHGRRWWWLLGAVNSTTDPATTVDPRVDPTPNGPFAGRVCGLDTIADYNIPTGLGATTNEDRVLVIRRNEVPLWRGPLLVEATRGQRAGAGGAMFVVHRYAAFQPNFRFGHGLGVVSGSGLVDPGAW